MRYRTLLLDADGTLLDFHRSETEAIRQTLQHFQLPDTAEWVEDYHRINDMLWKRLERGEVAKSDLRVLRFAQLLELHHVKRDVNAMATVYTNELSTCAYLLPGAFDACRELAKKCRLYIITNGFAFIQTRRIAATPLHQWIQKSYISEYVGYEKPDSRYFKTVFQDIPNFDPESTLIIGDSLTSDMAGGIAVGIDTCWINPDGHSIPDAYPITYTIPSVTDLPELVMGKEACCP